MNNIMHTLDEIKHELNDRVIIVKFIKKNGDTRIMKCTKNLQLIPPSQWPKESDDLYEDSDDVPIRVYDIEAMGWRSFHHNKVISIT